jgi:biopolymer transport protein ExbB
MAGISDALVATAVGLMVAIPAVVGFNYFNRRVRQTLANVDALAHVVLAQLKGVGDAPVAAKKEAK